MVVVREIKCCDKSLGNCLCMASSNVEEGRVHGKQSRNHAPAGELENKLGQEQKDN